jgi:hypothetical protein
MARNFATLDMMTAARPQLVIPSELSLNLIRFAFAASMMGCLWQIGG